MKIRDKVFQKKHDIVFRKIADEAILVPIRGNVADMHRLFMLNPVAEFIWQHFEQNTSLDAICMKLEDDFDVSREQAEKDLSEFVLELQKFDLITEVTVEITMENQPV